MSRVSDVELRRLAAALAHSDDDRKGARREETAAKNSLLERLRAALHHDAGAEALGRSLTQSLATYLNRPVRAIVGGSGATIPGAWRYVAIGGPVQWWIEFEAPLAAGITDAMLGGAGTGTKPGGRRARALVAKVADLFIAAMGSAIDALPPLAAVWADGYHPGVAQLAGRCAVATESFAWQAGIAVVGEVDVQPVADVLPALVVGLPETTAGADAHAAPARMASPVNREEQPQDESQAPADAAVSAVIAEVRSTVAIACAALHDVLRCPVTVAQPSVTEVDAPEVPEAALRLALTTGGQGALVVCAQRDAVVAFASGVVGARIPDAPETGSVVCALAEAGLREMVRGIASRLTRLSGVPQRIVHLAADAQLARTQHISASVTLHVAGSAANLRVLVPRWMVGAA